MAFTTKYPSFYFFLFDYILGHLQTEFRQNRRQKIFNWGASRLCRETRHSENVYLTHNTAFAN